MSMVLPDEVAIFLNLLGIPWVNIDDEEVRRAADHVRSFVAEVTSTFDDASAEITAMGADYSGASYEALLASWAHLSDTHLTAFESGGHTVAAAMDVAADLIVAAKWAAIAELSALALAAGALLMTGGGVALQPLVQLAARRIIWAVKSYIEQYIFAEVVERAIAEFETEIDRIVDTAAKKTFETASRLLGVHPAPAELRIDTDEVLRRARILESYADDIAGHYRQFADDLAGLNIEPDDRFDDLVVPTDAAVRPPNWPIEPPLSRTFSAPTEFGGSDRSVAERPGRQEHALAHLQTSPDIDSGQPPRLPTVPMPETFPAPAARAVSSELAGEGSGRSPSEAARSSRAEISAAPLQESPSDPRMAQTYTQPTVSIEPRNVVVPERSEPPLTTAVRDDRTAPTKSPVDVETTARATNDSPTPSTPGKAAAKPFGQHSQPNSSPKKARPVVADDHTTAPTPWTASKPVQQPATPWTTTTRTRPAATPTPEPTRSADVTNRPITAAADRAARPAAETDPGVSAETDRTDGPPARSSRARSTIERNEI
ncbi:hypothetical protein [Nocardia brasiliensis]|uniref:hypothetical protein n=1 Tax=Nocardia brasiliensis TaxID=37326 RepID=UPI003D8C553C